MGLSSSESSSKPNFMSLALTCLILNFLSFSYSEGYSFLGLGLR